MNACLACRKVKMKCRSGGQTTAKCERCARKSLDCVYQKHRRGRKPGTKISKLRPPDNISIATTPGHSSPKCAEGGIEDQLEGSHSPGDRIAESISVAADPDNLQPSGVLNREAMRGKFSLRHILCAGDGDLPETSDEAPTIRGEDPVRLGLVNLSVAKSLFENFIVILNPYISQLDPILHTFTYVRQKSSFLFSTMLAMSAKAFNPILYDKLYEHAQNLFTETFRRGSKSTETVQAILILTYWKQPQDTRVWTSLGYAIRMCMDMGWHRLVPYALQSETTMTEVDRRELRNVERTWYVLFVYDRSMSLQTGRPWMIERNAFIESIEAWCNDPMAIPNDQLLGAFVTLRLVTSAMFTLPVSKLQRSERASFQSIEPLLSLINGRIERWESRWTQTVETKAATEEEGCHPFLIRFYGSHLRLQLFSLPLQDILASSDSDASLNLEILWTAYSSAMKMLQLIPRYSSQLYFAQDSIHVMTAYCAAFLVKLLLCAPDSIASQIEPNTVNAIRAAAFVFSQQTVPPSSSCALQAKFLNKIATNVLNKRKERKSHSSAGSNANGMTEGPGPYQNQADLARDSRLPNEPERLRLRPVDSNTMSEVFVLQQGEIEHFFTDDDAWADIFAGTAFSTQHGIFLA